MKTLFEMLWVATVGLVIAVAANQLNPAGLMIERDYFPAPVARPPVEPDEPAATDTGGEVAETPETAPADTSADAPVVDAEEQAVLDRLRAKGFQPLSFDEAKAVYDDELYTFELYMFVDARSTERYEEGHIPGAHQFDHYYAHEFIDALMPLMQTSEKIVVYCTGGDCEDSEFATTRLTEYGVDPSRLYVYAGGIDDWTARGMPIERGARLSGDVVEGESP